jgi:hypothetical protein
MKYGLVLLITILSLTSCAGQTTAEEIQSKSVLYFEESGHTVRDDFLHFYETYGGAPSLGYPLTEEISVEGWTVQYFEKGRLEYHPENEPAYQVTVGWLGELLHRRRPPLPPAGIPPVGDPQRRYFSETGHTLSGDFLRYFDAHGGNVRFGWPISEPFLVEGRLTQDFQSARFFWMPDRDPPVTLEAIGRVHFGVSGLDERYLEPVEK